MWKNGQKNWEMGKSFMQNVNMMRPDGNENGQANKICKDWINARIFSQHVVSCLTLINRKFFMVKERIIWMRMRVHLNRYAKCSSTTTSTVMARWLAKQHFTLSFIMYATAAAEKKSIWYYTEIWIHTYILYDSHGITDAAKIHVTKVDRGQWKMPCTLYPPQSQ